MNLGVQAIHRVLTREIPINDKKSKKRYLGTKKINQRKIGKENIQEACSNN
jgi:hypothetical protein